MNSSDNSLSISILDGVFIYSDDETDSKKNDVIERGSEIRGGSGNEGKGMEGVEEDEGFFEKSSTMNSFLSQDDDNEGNSDSDNDDDNDYVTKTQKGTAFGTGQNGGLFGSGTRFDNVRRNLNTIGYGEDDDDIINNNYNDSESSDDDEPIGEIAYKRVKQFDDLIRDNIITLFPQKTFSEKPFDSNSNAMEVEFSDNSQQDQQTQGEKVDKLFFNKYVPRRIPLKTSVLTTSSNTHTIPAKASKYKTFGMGFSPLGNDIFVAMTPKISKLKMYGEIDLNELVYTEEIMKCYTSLFEKSDVTNQADFFGSFSAIYSGPNKYKYIFKLLEILTSKTENDDNLKKYTVFGSWLREVLSAQNETRLQNLVKSAKYEEACFLYLCGGQVEKAVSMAVLSSSPYLATIISALPHDHVRSLLYHQLDEWHKSTAKCSGLCSPALEKIYLLLSGKFQNLKGEFWTDFDWITCLGGYYWYGDSCGSDLTKFFDRLYELTEVKHVVPTPTPSLYALSSNDKVAVDTMYAMMMAFGAGKTGKCVYDVLNPEGHSHFGRNNVVSWVLIKYVGEIGCDHKHVADVAATVRVKVLYSLVDQLARNNLFAYRSFLIEKERLPKSLDRSVPVDEMGKCLCAHKEEEEEGDDNEKDVNGMDYRSLMKMSKSLFTDEKRYDRGYEILFKYVIIPNIIDRNRNFVEIYKLLESVFIGGSEEAAAARSQTAKYCPQPSVFINYIKYVEWKHSQKVSKDDVRVIMSVADALMAWNSKSALCDKERVAIEIMSENVANSMYDAIVELKFAGELSGCCGDNDDNKEEDENDVVMSGMNDEDDGLVKELEDRINSIPISKYHRRMILSDLSAL